MLTEENERTRSPRAAGRGPPSVPAAAAGGADAVLYVELPVAQPGVAVRSAFLLWCVWSVWASWCAWHRICQLEIISQLV